jgi:integrase
MSLTNLKIQAIKGHTKPQKFPDGDGLYLYVSPTGTKSWRFDYGYGGKRLTYTFGKYPALTLSDARKMLLDAKQMLANGINPSAEKKIKKILVRSAVEDNFSAIANDWYSSKSDNRSESWNVANELYLRRDLNPFLGSIAIREIDGKLLLAVLEGCAKERGLKTADRVRQTAIQVFEHAILKFKASDNPAAKLKRWAEIPLPIHRSHLAENEIGGLVDALDAYGGADTTKLAAKLLLLTFVRKTEICEATWDEFDIENAKWLIPAERMKMKDAHVVPLSTQALETLDTLRPYSLGSKYLFPKNSTILKPISRTTLNKMFAVMEGEKYKGKFTPHSVRGTASTWLNERGFRHDAIERQLAHSERNKIRASYNHADYFAERKQLMQAWADFLFPVNIELIKHSANDTST